MRKLLFLSIVLLVTGSAMNAASSSYSMKDKEISKRFTGPDSISDQLTLKWVKLLGPAVNYWEGDKKYTKDTAWKDEISKHENELLPFPELTWKQKAPLRLFLNYIYTGLFSHEERLRKLEDAQ